MTSRDEWRWTDEQGVQRLVLTAELRDAIASRVLPPSVLVWREGMAEWVPAFMLPAFADVAPKEAAPEPYAPPASSALAPARFGGTLPDTRGKMSTLLGIDGPGAPQKGAQGAPIVVPSGGGPDASPQGGAPITLRPEYSGAAFENAIPRGPSMEAVLAAPARPPPPVELSVPNLVASPPPVKPAADAPKKASASAENTSIGPTPKAPAAPKTSELSTMGPSPVRAASKVLSKSALEAPVRPAASPFIPRPVAEKPSAILRPSALLKPPVAPRTAASPGATPPAAKAMPSTPPAAPIEPSKAPPPTEVSPTGTIPPPADAAKPEVATTPEIAPVTAPSRIEDLPPAPPPREPSMTAILPPELTGFSGESMAGAVKLSHEVSKTVRIEGLLLDPTTAPLPEREPGGSDAPPTSPSPGPDNTSPHSYVEMPRERSQLSATAQGLRAVKPPEAAAPSQLPITAIATSSGVLVLMVISAFFVGRCSVKPTVAGGGARAVLANTVRTIRDALPQPPKPCWVAKQPVRWAPVVSNRIPFELLPLASGNVSIGYAKSSDEAVGIEVTPSSGQVNETFVDKASGDIERVAPTGAEKGYFIGTKENAGALRSLVQVPVASPFFVGLAGANLAAADRVDAEPASLWPIAGSDPLDAARVVIAGDKGYALSFRRDGAVVGGFLGPDRKPVGEIVKVVGSGGQVGKPMSGWNGREVAILFADRADDQSPWKIRLGHAPAGSIPASTEVIELPAGGPGGDAFAPGIAGLSDGRWVLIWTEGSAGARAVRAQTLGPDFVPVGDPIALSPPAGNFGQGMVAVAGAYVTAVFLQKGKSSFELWGGVLQCG